MACRQFTLKPLNKKCPVLLDQYRVILERDAVQLLSGGMILERGIIVQKNQLAGGMILENTPLPGAAIIVHDRKLAGGLIIDRHGRASGQSINA